MGEVLGGVILAAIGKRLYEIDRPWTAPDLIPIWRVLGWFTPALTRPI